MNKHDCAYEFINELLYRWLLFYSDKYKTRKNHNKKNLPNYSFSGRKVGLLNDLNVDKTFNLR